MSEQQQHSSQLKNLFNKTLLPTKFTLEYHTRSRTKISCKKWFIILNVFMILCWVSLLAIFGHLWNTDHRLDRHSCKAEHGQHVNRWLKTETETDNNLLNTRVVQVTRTEWWDPKDGLEEWVTHHKEEELMWARKRAQGLTVPATLPEDLDFVPTPMWHGFSPPVTPAPKDPTPSSGLWRHLHSCVCIHRESHIKYT